MCLYRLLYCCNVHSQTNICSEGAGYSKTVNELQPLFSRQLVGLWPLLKIFIVNSSCLQPTREASTSLTDLSSKVLHPSSQKYGISRKAQVEKHEKQKHLSQKLTRINLWTSQHMRSTQIHIR
ncbi:hypothetical protein Y032_0788g2355 [Ancylostoma ceylanicum]|uniref:Uncharacterized protein n=1 Tax=Ancylostoma ceylanicum TaxID=53326 RepID=A0A016WCB2_9BILA|nr:hypothetical protein Y032_0788g2355 [Ancylostoma ceylanicum]